MWNDKVSALFFAFSSMHASRLKPSGLIRSFLWQLVEIAPEEQAISILQGSMLRGQPTTSDLWIAFNTIAALVSKPVYCIIDCVDESVDKVVELLQRVLSFLEARVNFHFILLGQQHAFQGMNSIRHKMEIQPALTKDDVDGVIEDGIDQSDIPRLPTLREKVLRTLRDQSDGNFLWIKLMLGYLSKSFCLADALKRLKNLPRDIQAAYKTCFWDLLASWSPMSLSLLEKSLRS